MHLVNFNSPIIYIPVDGTRPSKSESIMQDIDNYFDTGSEKVYVMKTNKNEVRVITYQDCRKSNKQILKTKVKIALLFPLSFFLVICKLIYRSSLKINTSTKNVVTNGYGEYVVYKKGEKKIDKETFLKVNEVLTQFRKGQIGPLDNPQERHQQLKNRIKEIDPNLEITFIPRTLYDMIFIRKCMEEDMSGDRSKNHMCDHVSELRKYNSESGVLTYKDGIWNKVKTKCIMKQGPMNKESDKDDLYIEVKKIKPFYKDGCFHLSIFDNESGCHDEDTNVHDMAYRLNNAICEMLPREGSLILENIEQMLDEQIQFFQLKNPENPWREKAKKFGRSPSGDREMWQNSCYYSGIANILSQKDKRGVNLVKNALLLECSKIGETSALLYRGSNMKKDSPKTKQSKPYSISYGTSMFAGCIFDPAGAGATAFNYMYLKEGYITPVPLVEIYDPLSIYYHPHAHPICDLLGYGEKFHGRTKFWKPENANDEMFGIQGGYKGYEAMPAYLKIENLSKEEVCMHFEKGMKRAITLFSPAAA